MNGPLVYVDVKRAAVSRIPGRPQRWYWIARNGRNQRKTARSTERYTNYQDCLDAVWDLFGSDSEVYKREPERGNVRLRLPSA